MSRTVLTSMTFDGIHLRCRRPSQAGGVHLWISGTVNKALARQIARFGSGWIPWGSAYADITGAITAMKDNVHEVGGDHAELQASGSRSVCETQRRVNRLRGDGGWGPCALIAAGVTM